MTFAAVDVDRTKEKVDDVRKARQLPMPAGYKILIAIPELEEKTEGGIIKPTETLNREQMASAIGFVMKLGPDAYKDKEKFPSGAYCKEGDFILMRSYSGTRITIHGKEFRLINDDSVEAVVEDPRGYARA